MRRRIERCKLTSAVLGIILFALSAGIVGNNDCNVVTPTWVYVVYAIIVIACAASLFYTDVLEDRLNERIRKRLMKQRKLEREKMAAEMDAELDELLSIIDAKEKKSKICNIEDYRRKKVVI